MKKETNIGKCLKIFNFFEGAVLTFLFLWMAKTQYEDFIQEPTGTILQDKIVSNLEFPAVSICTDSFQGISFSPGDSFLENIARMFRQFEEYGDSALQSLWKRGYTLDEVLNTVAPTYFRNQWSCRVGIVSCKIHRFKKVFSDFFFQMKSVFTRCSTD